MCISVQLVVHLVNSSSLLLELNLWKLLIDVRRSNYCEQRERWIDEPVFRFGIKFQVLKVNGALRVVEKLYVEK